MVGAVLASLRSERREEDRRRREPTTAGHGSASDSVAARRKRRRRLGRRRPRIARRPNYGVWRSVAASAVARVPASVRSRQYTVAPATIGAVQLYAGLVPETLSRLRQASTLLERLHPGGSLDGADLRVNLARTYLELGKVDAAIAATGEAAALWQGFEPASRAAGLARPWQARSLLAARPSREARLALLRAPDTLAVSAPPTDRALLAQTRFIGRWKTGAGNVP